MANNWDADISMHVNRPYELPARLTMVPIVRGWKAFIYIEVPSETPAEIVERLNVTIRPVNMTIPMVEVNI
jgi:hypothetical protein